MASLGGFLVALPARSAVISRAATGQLLARALRAARRAAGDRVQPRMECREFVEAARAYRHVPGDRWFVDETYLKIAPMGTLAVKRRGVLARWLACGCRAGADCFVALPDSCRGSGCRVVRGPAGAPGAAQWRGRTSWTPASGSRSSEARKRFLAGLAGLGVVGVPGVARLAEWSHMHPSGTCQVAGAMTVLSGGRAAQSGHRARLGRLMRKRELTRGLATPPGW
jgi:hypothetical protein